RSCAGSSMTTATDRSIAWSPCPDPRRISPETAMADDPKREAKPLRHELRTCVNQVLGYSELLQEDLSRAGQDRFTPDLKRISAAARRLETLVDKVPDEPGAEKPATTASAPAAAARPELPPAPDLPPRACLLVVDDDADNREILSRLLRLKGHTVLEAGSGPEALALVDESAVDLVILDIMMPDVSGYEVLERLRER